MYPNTQYFRNVVLFFILKWKHYVYEIFITGRRGIWPNYNHSEKKLSSSWPFHFSVLLEILLKSPWIYVHSTTATCGMCKIPLGPTKFTNWKFNMISKIRFRPLVLKCGHWSIFPAGCFGTIEIAQISTTWQDCAGLVVTKDVVVNFSVRDLSYFVKVLFTSIESHSYLAGVAAA